MTTLALAGCRPEPIGSYLKALGVLRLVAAQVDPSATGRWEGDTFRLVSTLDSSDLVHFLTQEYRPTPVLSPWNSDSGFKEAGSKATVALRAVEASTDPRFGDYQDAIAVVRQVLQSPGWATRSKGERTTLLRNRLPDIALEWLDAAVVLRPESPAFPALLGTGGNFGRLELSPTFIGRLLQVLEAAPKAQARSRDWLRAALFDEGTPALRSDPVGQFDPGSAGGLRGDVLSGKPLTNPWDFVLLIEGSLVWASGVARRLGGATSVAAMPFTVAPSPVGQGSLTRGERAKAELWAPLWPEPLGLPALHRLFSEGRISWSEGQARTGLDVVRAVHTLGVDAGISEFVRHVVAERMGQSPLAVPIGRFKVGSDPRVAVSASLDPWVVRLRRPADATSAPSSLVRSAVRVDRALFAAASGRPSAFQDLLIATSKAEALCGRTERSRTDGSVPPVPWLSPRDWLPALDDGTREFRLAASLVLARDERLTGNRTATVRSLVRPIEIVAGGNDRIGRVVWSREEAPILGLGVRSVQSVLANVLVERSEVARARDGDDPSRRQGIAPWFPAACRAGQGDTEALASGEVDLNRFSDLVEALLFLRPDSKMTYRWTAISSSAEILSPAWRILAPFYTEPGSRPAGAAALRPEASWARGLVAGAVEPVLTEALLRWRQARLLPVYNGRSIPVIARKVDGLSLAAALLCAAPRRDIDAAVNTVIDLESQTLSEGDAS